MDVQQLFTSLKKEAECPLCLETVKDPKTLPCLHSFCLWCIDKHAGYAKRKLETTIKCPVCQACFQIPEGDTFGGGLPTSFHLNRLVDLLALRDDSEEAQRCNSCEENNTATCYCFVCQNFLCKDCFDAHQRLKATRGHRNVLIENLQAQDVEELMHRPAMCTKKYHENEPLDYYCQDCSVCICHKCSIVSHNRHSLVELQEAAEEQKMQMTQVFARVQEKLVIVESKISEQTELMKKSEDEICAAERKVTKTVQEIIRTAKEHETAVKTKLAEIKVKQQRNYAAEIGNFQLLAAQLKSSVECGEGIVQRSIGPEILQAGHAVLGRCEELLTTQDIEVCTPQHVVYCVNVEAINNLRGLVPGQVFETNTDPSQSSAKGRGLTKAEAGTETSFTVTTRNSKGSQCYDEQDQLTVIVRSQKGEEEETKINDCKNGTYVVRYKPKSVGLRDISVEVNGQPLTGSPWRVQATGHQYKAIHSFGSHGIEPGQFKRPGSIAVNKRNGKIAIADPASDRVHLFDREWKYLRTIRDMGLDAEKIWFPRSVEFTTFDEVIVIHGDILEPRKMLLFTEHGDFIKVISQHLIDPWSVSVRDDGHMIVCDRGDKSVKVLSPDGTGLVQSFKGSHGFSKPTSAVYHEDKFFVLFDSLNYVHVFNNEGLYLYDIGKEELCAGKLFFTKKFTIDAFNNLIVCDNNNNRRFQVFSLDGKFVNSFNIEEIKSPSFVAAFEDNKLLVCDYENYVVHVLQ
ncbi:E3 ubiquitin-protein ligase TRIM71-like [Pocillopora verrucosa]|uniref:E3 ubiquitin-protein ligase TRIM71-like n=1 Tax=Pocillopora verrucosa TaxID=203993 RepID=UPI00333F5903